ncbi:hypothetical protein FDP41_003831 [Naegleria fowleri]|uniref:Profilin n=1 Tax=Naegleria fowleri TaxID=5763 RepID=A0A6A5BT66_NAEFO|nr:uncharacterized protein FDP41_003831 [Naegleria fowleri]KAF0977178.1 hypothetical protein FDP41_003831 [Naegleria fowleri]
MTEEWSEFIQREIIENGNATHGALISISDGGIWAKTFSPQDDPNLSGEECPKQWLSNILNGFSNPSEFINNSDISKGCIQLFNKQFIVTNIMKDRVMCAKNGVDGCYLFKTQQALLLVMYGISNEPGECYLDCENFARYLISQGL